MKKQVLTLAMCLALTTTAALANTCPVSKTAATKTQVKQSTAAVKMTAKKSATTPEAVLTPEQLTKKQFEERMAKVRENLYLELNLSAEQKVKAEANDLKTRTEAEPLFKKMREEKAKLVELKTKKACPEEILKQKQALKAARRELKKHFKASNEAFEALLTKEQQLKFKELREAKKAEMKKHRKEVKELNANSPKGTGCPLCKGKKPAGNIPCPCGK